MATTRRRFIIATFLLSCVAVALVATSLATSSWVEATLTSEYFTDSSVVNYGLFRGHIEGKRLTSVAADLTMSCLMSDNVCYMSCQVDDDSKRQAEMQDLVNGDASYACPFVDSGNDTANPDKKFINAGLWVSTVLFLSVALFGGVLAAVFAVVNTTTNPVEPMLGVLGLYVWNGLAVVCTLLVLILWGSQFADTLVDNIAYTETITGNFSSKGNASLGFSYWLVLIALLLHIANESLLATRAYLLAREPPPPTIKMEENTDGIIFLY